MRESNKTVSILMPVYNASKVLKKALENLLSQTHRNLEIIAVDDCSTDDSLKILRFFGKRDKRLRVLKNRKRYGLSVCLNRGLKKAKGQFIAFMDPNDSCYKNRLEKQVSYLLSHPKTLCVGTQCEFVDQEKDFKISNFPSDHESISNTLFAGLSIQFETAMINRLLLPKDVLRFDGISYRFLPTERKVIYANVFLRLLPYGEINNLTEVLYIHKNPQPINSLFEFGRLWLKSAAVYDYRPSLWTFFFPLLAPVKTIFQSA